MSARRVSREPYRIRRNPREVWVAIAAAVAIVLVTIVAVWILAPSNDSGVTPSISPAVDSPVDTTPTTTPATTAPPEGSDSTATTGG